MIRRNIFSLKVSSVTSHCDLLEHNLEGMPFFHQILVISHFLVKGHHEMNSITEGTSTICKERAASNKVDGNIEMFVLLPVGLDWL